MSMYYRKTMITSVFGMSWGLVSISIFLVLPTISSIGDPVPANEGDQSICKQHHRVTLTKEVSYMETYSKRDSWGNWYTAKRMNFKTLNFTKFETVEMCCPGYEPHQILDDVDCVPVCPSDCLNGTCHRPNKCICDPGYVASINNSTAFSECQPDCTSGCHGGSCIEPETCSCDIGYSATEDQSSCKASCSGVGGSGLEDCPENATCIAPDTCKCDNGYAAFINETAEDEDTRWPWLWAEKAPLGITFNSSNFICKPLCKPECKENAYCIAPNECQCTTGYTAAPTSNEPIKCLPVCEQNCVNSFCSKPNVCTCHEGYKPHDWLGKFFCEPICRDDCINGKCTQPNHCECAFGYEKLVIRTEQKEIVSENVCVPVCPGNCSNGRCVSPGQCHCNEGYVFKTSEDQTDAAFNNADKRTILGNMESQGSCQPNCEPDCLSEYFCFAPNQCQIQYNNDKVLKGFPKLRTRIISNTDDCGIGQVLTKNDRNVCFYKLNDTECYEPNLCAIIIVDKQEMIKNFSSLRSIISAIEETKESSWNVTNSENNHTSKWRIPRCTNECRILISSEGLPKIVDDDEIIDCHELKFHNETTGVFIRPIANPSASRIHHKGIRRRLGGVWIRYPAICFLEDHLTFNTTTSMKAKDLEESNVRVVVIAIIGTAITLVVIFGLGVLLYRGRKKLSNLRHFRGDPASGDIVLEGSMAQFSTDGY